MLSLLVDVASSSSCGREVRQSLPGPGYYVRSPSIQIRGRHPLRRVLRKA